MNTVQAQTDALSLQSIPGYNMAANVVSKISAIGGFFIVRRVPISNEEKTYVTAMNVLESASRIAMVGGAALVVYRSLPESVPYLVVTAVGGVLSLITQNRNVEEVAINLSAENPETQLTEEFKRLKTFSRHFDKLIINYPGSNPFAFTKPVMLQLKEINFSKLELKGCDIPVELQPLLTRSSFYYKQEVKDGKKTYQMSLVNG